MKRFGKSRNRRPGRNGRFRKLAMEQLENRQLLANSAANVFAQFQGEMTQPFERQSYEIFLIPGNFQTGFGPATVGFLARPADGSNFAPIPVDIESLSRFDRGKKMPILESRPRLPDGGSIALAELKRGAYQVEVAGGEAVGKWQLDVFLPGDVNGDFKVTTSDIEILQTALWTGASTPELLAVGDANRDGILTIFDVQVAQGNLGASTSIRPLTLSAQLSAESDTGIAGDNQVSEATVQIVGLTMPRAGLSADADGDGFDDGYTIATPHPGPTNFTLNAQLTPGENPIRIQARDSFGQTKISELVVTLDAVAPTVLSTSPAGGETVQADFDAAIPVEIVFSEPMIAATLSGALTLSGNRTGSLVPVAPSYDAATNTLRFGIDPALPDTLVTVVVDGGAMDVAGNRVGWYEFAFRRELPPSVILTEANYFTRHLQVPVQLGPSGGRKILSFDVSLLFDTTDATPSIEDTLNVYLVDQASPWISLLDAVAPGLPVISISPDGAEYLPDLVSFDGTTIEIDVSSVVGDAAGLLQFELAGGDSDDGSRARVGLAFRIEAE